MNTVFGDIVFGKGVWKGYKLDPDAAGSMAGPGPSRTPNQQSQSVNSLYTVEQVELIRRLRGSGITKDQIMQAFDEFDRLEADLNRLVAAAATSMAAAAIPFAQQMNYLQMQQTFLRQHQMQIAAAASALRTPKSENNGSSGGENGSTPVPASPAATGKEDGATTMLSAAGSTPLASYLISSSPTKNISLNGHHDPYLDEEAELQEFMQRSDSVNNEEIRKFVARYNIKQHYIAETAKISQAYVSRYFRGDTSDMTDRIRIAIYSWYLTCKRSPWKLKQMCQNSGMKRMVSDSGDLIPLKRERFTFKSTHLSILERYYNTDPYPDLQTREQIVEECNQAMAKPGMYNRELTDRERVTLNVVTNWFNNRRKEAKQKMRQQGLAAPTSLTGLDLSLTSQAGAWDHNSSTPAQIVCQPDIDNTDSDQSQDDNNADSSSSGFPPYVAGNTGHFGSGGEPSSSCESSQHEATNLVMKEEPLDSEP